MKDNREELDRITSAIDRAFVRMEGRAALEMVEAKRHSRAAHMLITEALEPARSDEP